MSISRSIRRPIKRSIMQSIIGHFPFNKVVKAVTRYFSTLNPIVSANYELVQPVTFSGDFEIKFKLSTIKTGTQNLMAGATRGNNEIVIDLHTSGSIRFFAYNGITLNSVISGNVTHTDGKLNIVKCRYIQGVASLYFNDVLINSANWSLSGAETVKYFGSRLSSGNNMTGILSDIELIENPDVQPITQTFPLNFKPNESNTEVCLEGTNSITAIRITDDLKEEYTLNGDDWVGQNIITEQLWENPAVQGTHWTFNPTTRYWSYVGDGSLNSLQFLYSSKQPAFAKFAVEVISISGDMTATASSGTTIDTVGGFEFEFDKSSYVSQQFKRRSGIASCVLGSLSFKSILKKP